MGDQMVALENTLLHMNTGMRLLERKLDERYLLISATPAVAPVRGLLTSGFGYRSDPFTGRRAFHRGVDIVAPAGKDESGSNLAVSHPPVNVARTQIFPRPLPLPIPLHPVSNSAVMFCATERCGTVG